MICFLAGQYISWLSINSTATKSMEGGREDEREGRSWCVAIKGRQRTDVGKD